MTLLVGCRGDGANFLPLRIWSWSGASPQMKYYFDTIAKFRPTFSNCPCFLFEHLCTHSEWPKLLSWNFEPSFCSTLSDISFAPLCCPDLTLDKHSRGNCL